MCNLMTNASFHDAVEVNIQEMGALASTIEQGGQLAIQLAANSSVGELNADIVVRNGIMFLDGGGRTISMHKFQFRVEGGSLCLYNLHLVDGGVCQCLDCLCLSVLCLVSVVQQVSLC